MTTTMRFVPTPQAQKVYAHLVRHKMIPEGTTIHGATTLEDALKITDETERNKLAQIAVDRQHNKAKKAVTPPSLHMPAYKPYKHNQKIILGSDTEGRRTKDPIDAGRNDILLYAEAMGIDETEANIRLERQERSDNGHITYGPMPAPVIEPEPIATPEPAAAEAIADLEQMRRQCVAERAARMSDFVTASNRQQHDRAAHYSREAARLEQTIANIDKELAMLQPQPEPIPITRAPRPRETTQPTPTTAESFARSVGRTVTQKGRNLWVAFDAKPSSEIRDQLKHYGFRWAAKRQAWWLDTTHTASTINDMAAG